MKKIALIGTAESSAYGPYDDASWEIWGVSARAKCVTRADRWFEIHRLDGEGKQWAENWRKVLKVFSHDVELVMFYPEPDLCPNVTAYPTERIADRFGTFFMTSSFSWMMALAIDELRPLNGKPIDGEIGIWGVEMEYGTEYREQRSGFRHFIDLARVMGIRVTLLSAGGLAMEPVPYPLWQDDPLLCKLAQRNNAVQTNLKTYEESLRLTRSMLAQNQGAMQEIERSKKKGYRRAERIASLEKEHEGLMQTSGQLSKDITQSEGVNEEQRWLRDYLSP